MQRDECVTFKVFLKNNEVTEVKKLMVDGNNASITNVSFITEMLQSAFPILLDVNFRITWRDRRGDDLPIEKDEDLIKALTEMDGSVKTLYLIAGYKSSNAPQVTNPPVRIWCGVCNKEITDFRYTCLQCDDYNHCIECEYSGHHPQHGMMRTSILEPPFIKREYKRGCNRCDSIKNVPDQDCSFQEQAPRFHHPSTNQVGSTAANMASNAAATTAIASAPFEQSESATSRLNKEQNASYQFMKGNNTTAPSNIEVVPEKTSALNIAIGLRRLLEMGFQDEQALVVMLKRYNGDVNEVARDILENA